MTARIRRSLLTALVIACAVAAPLIAATPKVITIETSFTGSRSHAALDVTLTSHVPDLSRATVQVIALDGTTTVPISEWPVVFALDNPVTLTIPVSLRGEAPRGAVAIRVMTRDGVVAVTETNFQRFGETVRSMTPAAYAHEVENDMRLHARAASQKKAAALMARVIRSGRRPVKMPIAAGAPTEDSTSVGGSDFEQAWNQLVDQQSISPAIGECGPWAPSIYNYTFSLDGVVRYDDAARAATLALQEAGYPVRVTTVIELEDQCGNTTYQVRSRQVSTSAGGYFSIATIRSIDDPAWWNPLNDLSTTAPEVGLRQGSAISTVAQTLQPDQMSYSWYGTAHVEAVYTAANSAYRHFFRWNDLIKSLQTRWSWEGFGSYYTGPFKAGYDAGQTYQAQFNQLAPGLVSYADGGNGWPDGRWSTRWIMAHEFGHFFQYQLQSGQYLNNAQQHTICGTINAEPAFFEGFADWHASYFETEGRNVFIPCAGGECYTSCPAGWSREGNVQAFFWDLFDGVNDPTFDQSVDTVGFATTLLQSWGREYVSFDDFYTDFRNRGIWGANIGTTDALRRVDQVDAP